MEKRVLIVEDNEVHRQALCKIIKELYSDIHVHYAPDASTGFCIALEHHIQLFIIDIILNAKNPADVSGLNLAKEIRGIDKYRFTPFIFITSLEDPKLYSYSQLHCFAYIEKPFNVTYVKESISKALEFPEREEDDRYLYFRKDGIIYSVYIKDIIYIYSSRRKIKVFCMNDEIEIPYKTCQEMLHELDSSSFIQCSRNCIVNRNFIEHVDYINRFIKLKYIDSLIEIGIVMKNNFKRKLEDS